MSYSLHIFVHPALWQEMDTVFSHWERYHELWRVDKETNIKEMLASAPSLSDYDVIIQRYVKLEKEIAKEPNMYRVGAIDVTTGK